jgi:hypothetical protein
MDERCGAWQAGDDPGEGAIEFRIFFPAGVDPHVTSIVAAGDFQAQLGGKDWDFPGGLALTRDTGDPRGDFWTARSGVVPAGFYEYQYRVEFDGAPARVVTDPCARYSGVRDRNSGVVVGGSRPGDNAVRPLPDGRKPLTDLIVYELMIDDFTAEYRRGRAPLDAVTDRLDDLLGLGVNAIEFMPWTAWKSDDLDWGYEPFQYFAVESRYANDLTRPEEKLSWLKRLVSACHDRGIHVIMDGVYNHVSRDFPYRRLYRDPELCPFTAHTWVKDFPGLQDLDFGNGATGELIEDICRYWIDEFGIDGIRFDNTVNFYQPGDLRGLPEILSSVADRLGPEFSLTLEHLDQSAVTVTNTTAATSFWDNSLHDECFGALWTGTITTGLLNALNNRRFLSAGKVPTLYLSNHDHSSSAWQAGARANVGSVGGWWRLQPFIIALYTATAVPLLRNGDEVGEEHFLPEDDHNTGRRVIGRSLRWKLAQDPIGTTLRALHGRLGRIRAEHPGLRSPFMYPAEWATWQTQPNPVGAGIDLAHQTVVYHRWAPTDEGVDNFVVVLNFSGEDRFVDVPFPATGKWADLLAGFDGGEPWSVEVGGPRAPVPVGSHWGRVLWRLNK